MEIDFGKVINKNQLLGWRWAPMCDAVRRSPVLSDGAKILYNEIVSFMWQKDNIRAWPNQQTLADNLGISRQAVSRRLKELEVVGLLGVQRNGLGKSNDIYLYDLDLERLQVEQDDTGAFRPISQDAEGVASRSSREGDDDDAIAPRSDAPSDKTDASLEVNGSKPVVTPDVTLSLHQDVKQTLHQDVTLPLHQDVTSATRDADVAEASGSDVADVPEIDISAEEETGKIINREEEAAPDFSDIPTTSSNAKPDLSIIHRRDVPPGNCVTWNFAMTEESVVIDGERFIVFGDEHAVDRLQIADCRLPIELPSQTKTDVEPEAEVTEIETTLPDSEIVEAEVSDDEATVNREKMVKLLSSVGGTPTTEADNSNECAPPPSMSREEMRAKLEAMDWRDGIDEPDS